MKTGTGPASTLRCGVFVATADRMPEVHAMWHGHNWRRCRLLCLLPKTENQSYARRHYAWNCYQLSCDARIGAGGPRAVVAVPRWRATHRRGRAAMEGHAPSWPCRDGGPRTVVAVPRWRATLRRGRAAAADCNKELMSSIKRHISSCILAPSAIMLNDCRGCFSP
jgi:hypothetical protein